MLIQRFCNKVFELLEKFSAIAHSCDAVAKRPRSGKSTVVAPDLPAQAHNTGLLQLLCTLEKGRESVHHTVCVAIVDGVACGQPVESKRPRPCVCVSIMSKH